MDWWRRVQKTTSSGVSQFVDGFNPNERREWEEGIRTCMQRRDWTDLIPHLRSTVTLQKFFFDHGHSENSDYFPTKGRADHA